MDTSQAHLSSKSATATKDSTKPDNLSKDELTAVLKYGAQKMYVISFSHIHIDALVYTDGAHLFALIPQV